MERLEEIRKQFFLEIGSIQSEGELLDMKGRYIGKKRGIITELMGKIKEMNPEEKRTLGSSINEIKALFESELKKKFEAIKAKPFIAEEDTSLPPLKIPSGHLHPITMVRREIEEIFKGMGYAIESGPLVEDTWHNFEALNTPKDHPARDMQDTFYISDDVVLRTQTSSVQIRTMERRKPPIKMIAPGKSFRRDSDVSHSPMFFQVEGLVVDIGINMGHLIGTLNHFYSLLFNKALNVRLRPSYFPFTEPSAETDLPCIFCDASGCNICKGCGYIEIGGSGMVHPQVLRMMNVDPEKYSGFAFGLGIDRIAMLKYGIDHIKHFYENDIRFLEQF